MKDNEVNGNRIEIEFCKRKLQSPFILTSGPLCYSAEGMIKGHQAGAGAVVTKTIRLSPAINPIGHIARFGQNSLLNAEKWADIPFEQWCEVEIPRTVASGATVIASVGHTLKEAKAIVGEVEKAGSHMIELVSYREETLLPMLDFTKAHVSIPVICKLSGNWDDPIESAKKCIEHGADGICAIDSIGPVLKIDIRKARPVMFGNDGYGWLTGEAIRPIALRIVAEIAMRFSKSSIKSESALTASVGIPRISATFSCISSKTDMSNLLFSVYAGRHTSLYCQNCPDSTP